MNPARIAALVIALATVGAAASPAQQNAARYDVDKNWFYGNFALDPAFIATVGYARTVPVFGHGFQVSVDGGVVAAQFDLNDYRARLQGRTTLVRVGPVRLNGSIAFLTRGTSNSIYRGLTFGSDFTGTLGMYTRGWYAAGEFGFDKDVITHVTNTEWYKTNFFAAAQDGWYLNAGGTWHYGFVTGVSVGAAELSLRAGAQRNQKWEEMTPPFYAAVGVAVGF